MQECNFCGKLFEEDEMIYEHGRLVCEDCGERESAEEMF